MDFPYTNHINQPEDIMAVRNIIKDGDETLLKKSRAVEQFDERLWTLLDDMLETMRAAEGVGLAAVQVGVLRRVCIVDIGDGLIELINPEIIAADGVQEDVEGCLSYPNQWAITRRPRAVKVKAQNRRGKKFIIKGEDLKARALCHEIDHLDGIVFKAHVIRELDESELT